MSSSGGIQNERGLRVSVGLAVQRQTVKTDFGSVLGQGVSKAADVALSATGLVAPAIPGGSVVAAAVNGLASVRSGLTSGGQATTLNPVGGNLATSGGAVSGTGGYAGTAYGGGGAVGGSSGGVFGGIEQRAAGGSSSDQLMMATKQMQEMNQSFNLQYLQLQQQMQADNRQFTLLSNVMKTKHDTAKNAINNVR